MTNAYVGKEPVAGRVVEWIGCLLGTGFVVLFAMFAFGGNEQSPPLNTGTASLGVMLLGFLLAWWNCLVGGLVSLLGIGAFYAWHFSQTGMLAGGPVFPLCFVPGILLAAGWMLRHFR